MARLEEVKILDMKDGKVTRIKFKNNEYLKTDGKPRIGDIVLSEVEGFDVTKGGFYRVEHAYSSGDVEISDDENFRHVRGLDTITVFRKKELTNQDLSFYRAGRGLGELKVGDIVRAIQHTGAHDKGVIVEITDSNRYKFGDIDGYLVEWEYFELVAPVESRTDIERSESDE